MKSSVVVIALRHLLNGDTDKAMEIIGQIEAEEDRIGNRVVAAQLRRLRSTRFSPKPTNEPDSLEIRAANRPLSSMILRSDVRQDIQWLIHEWRFRDRLAEHSLYPRCKLLFHGPSGTGKTALSEAIAYELGVPLCVVDYSRTVNPYVGETTKCVAEAIGFAKSTRCVLLFDEADSLLSRRSPDTDGPSREINRTTNYILTAMDSFSASGSIMIFATNFYPQIDKSLCRRIEMQVELHTPNSVERSMMAKMVSGRWPSLDSDKLINGAESMKSLAEIEDHILNCARRVILDDVHEE